LQLLNLWQRLVRAKVAPSVLGDGATLAVRSPTAPVIWSWHAGIARSRIIDQGITSHVRRSPMWSARRWVLRSSTGELPPVKR
jgi:hypothetical protein